MFTLTVKYDKNPHETSWVIRDLTRKTTVAAISNRKSRKFPPFKRWVQKKAKFVVGNKYLIIMKDTMSNGFKKGFILITGKRGSTIVYKKKFKGAFKKPKRKYTFILTL